MLVLSCQNRFFGSDRTPNKSFEPLSASHRKSAMDTQTDKMSNIYQLHPFFKKGLPPKQPESFGCFVCPNWENL
jgi:hypothetical protein